MLKKWIQLSLSILLILSFSIPVNAAENSNGEQKLVIVQDSNQMIHNGTTVLATGPSSIIKGVTFVSARSIIKELEGTLAYDKNTKEYALKMGDNVIKLKVGELNYTLNDTSKVWQAAPLVQKGTLMVPVKSIAAGFGLKLKLNAKEKKIELTWKKIVQPIAQFSVSTSTPYATQTYVEYTNESYSPYGANIVDEKWENQIHVFDDAGFYTVTHWVMDENGLWSEPYSVILAVKPPNQPPVASFVTEKDTYKMGEYIRYYDRSTDDENAIVKSTWTNQQNGFFVPGPQTITLLVTDVNGATNEISKTITITDETKYTEEEFNLIYTPIGEKFTFNGSDVLKMTQLNYYIYPTNHQQTLFRSNSPETIVDEGITYEDQVQGNVRFMLHHFNSRLSPVKVYIIATNNNAKTATVNLGPIGMGGPSTSVSSAGRLSVGRYLESRELVNNRTVSIPAGESRVLYTELSAKKINTGETYSMIGDVVMDATLKVQVVVVDATKDVMKVLPMLPKLPSIDRHVRGTFELADRILTLNDLLGETRTRIIFGENVVDKPLSGYDTLSQREVNNTGNYGTFYTVQLNNVKANTAILLNPRGGHYSGAFTVNGEVVYTTYNSILKNPNEVGMLYRTGDELESVTIEFVPAPGSNLPINLLFVPMPEIK
ncbi:MAG: stalk domain-containing protein [Candidatus Cohnella colombiensis]|uniref:Stalk domain-containing protein n=1 Tax=Candidatus Cohnella colombiensis TaxID=3121368 RepID=A0AA95JBU9_9BACL|nr:MAG: stalk domain-containing protein [Cohnella sp.]